jgi:arsenate reductase (glutaredoxin)
MLKVYHLATCSTNNRILNELDIQDPKAVFQEIKTEPITAEQIDEMKKLSGSYESLFSRTAMKYRAMGLGEKELKEADYRQLILEEYTFLKRPVIIVGNNIFVGNAPKVVAAAKAALA